MARVCHLSDIMDENTLGEWSDGDDDWIWDVDESDLWEWSDPEADDIIRNIDVQSGGGEKRKSDGDAEPEQDFYVIESSKKTKSKKFRMTATDHTIRFTNVASDLDLIDSYERTQRIFEQLLNDVTEGMNERPGTFCITIYATGHTYFDTFYAFDSTYTRTCFFTNRTRGTIESRFSIKRYSNCRYNTRRGASR